MSALGDYIRERRRKLKITQSDLSNRLKSLGLERKSSTIANWETGRYSVPIEIIPSLAKALEENSVIRIYDLAGVIDQLPAPDLIRLLETFDDVELSDISDIAKAYRKNRKK